MTGHRKLWALMIPLVLAGCATPTAQIIRETVLVTQPPLPTYTPYPAYTLPAAPIHTPTPALVATETAVPTSTRTPKPTPSPPPDGVVTAKALNLRAGPDTVYDKVGILAEEEELDVVGRTATGDWLRVTAPDGTTGWVSANYVELSLSLDDIPVTTDIPPTPTPSGPTPTPLPIVDAEIERIARGEHGELSQPSQVGEVAAGGETEVAITNDTPYELTILVGDPNSVSITIEACTVCKVYSMVGPIFCPKEGRPQTTVRLKPGVAKVAAKVSDPSVIPFLGTWELNGDTKYFNCFYIITKLR